MRAAHAIIRASVALMFCLAAAVSEHAYAQNYDGAGLLRFGAFGQVSANNMDIKRPEDIRGSLSAASGAGGFTFGYDWMFTSGWVLGIESDIGFDSWCEQRGPREYSVDYMATTRVRLGAYARPDLFFYATGGVAALGITYQGFPNEVTLSRDSNSHTMFGGTVGAGMEYDWHGMILFTEYLYSSYGNFSFREFVDDEITLHNSIDVDQHAFRLGVKFIIGHDHRETYYGGCCDPYGPVGPTK